MPGATRRFYTRYYLLTVIAPAYLTAAAFYGTAWLLTYLTNTEAPGFIILVFLAFGASVILLHRLPRLLARLGFLLSGVTRSVVEPGPSATARLAGILPVRTADNRPVPQLTPQVVELGPVPYLAVGSGADDHLWISTHLLEQATTTQLKCLVAHEAGHLASVETLSHDWLVHGSWLIALPVAYILSPFPLLLSAAALLHGMLGLKLMLWNTGLTEAAADAWACAAVGRDNYAAAMLEYHDWITGDRRPVALVQRLTRIGYTVADIEAARRTDAENM